MVAVAIAGSAVIGGVSSAVSGSKAAKAQENASAQSIAEQQREYDQTRADLAPYRNTGYGALGMLSSAYGVTPTTATGGAATGGTPASTSQLNAAYQAYQNSSGYQFQMDQGVQAAERSAASRGLLASGGTEKAITRYASGLADSNYNQYLNGLQSLAGVGQSATNTTSAAGQSAANNISNAYTQAGNAQASSYANTGSAINSTINNGLSAYLYSQGGLNPLASSGFYD